MAPSPFPIEKERPSGISSLTAKPRPQSSVERFGSPGNPGMKMQGWSSFWTPSTGFRCRKSSRTAWNIQIRSLSRSSRGLIARALNGLIRMPAPAVGSVLVVPRTIGLRSMETAEGRFTNKVRAVY